MNASPSALPEDRRKYRDKVRRSLDVFARMLRERLFEEHPSTVGQEIELNLVDEHGMPSMRNAAALDAIASPAWATVVFSSQTLRLNATMLFGWIMKPYGWSWLISSCACLINAWRLPRSSSSRCACASRSYSGFL